jgi:segregation and condensation protein A
MSEEVYRIRLADIFEGPMDLLLFLIKKNEVNIYDIPIATITDQYLDYLNMMREMNIDIAGDFLVMAATLTHIKSRMLLPVHEEMEDAEEDPRLEIARPLAEYIQLKEAAAKLRSRSILGEDTFVRRPEKGEVLADDAPEWVRVDLFELIDAFQRILKNITPEQRVDLTADRISVKDRISEIVNILEKQASVTFDALFDGDTDRGMIVVTFLAVLEMVRLALIRVYQQQETGILRIFYQ